MSRVDEVVRHGGPEPTSYDKMRHESMVLRQNGLYGIPKFFLYLDKTFCCEACVFGRGEHIPECVKLTV